MHWEAIGVASELVGAIAVVATLVYLTIQIRLGRQADRSSAYDSSIRNLIEIRQAALNDEEFCEILYRGLNDPEDLSELEKFRFRLFVNNVMLSFYHVWSQPQELSSEMWETQIPAITRVVGSPGGKWFWESHRMEFVVLFRSEIDRIVASTSDIAFK